MIRNKRKYIADLFRRPESKNESLPVKDLLFFGRFIKPLWKLGLVSLALTVGATFLGSLLPLSSKIFIDFVIGQKGFSQIEKLLSSIRLDFLAESITYFLSSVNLMILSILIIGIFMGGIGILQSVINLKFQQEITYSIQTALFDRLLRFPLSFIKEKQVGYLMSRVSNDVYLLQYFFSSTLPQLSTNLFYFLFSFGVLITLSPKISLVLVCVFPVWAIINVFFAVRVRAVSHTAMEREALVSQQMQEVISGAEAIKTNTSEKREVVRISQRIRRLFNTRLKSMFLTTLNTHSMKAGKLLLVLSVIWISVREIEKGMMTIGDMTALITYVFYLSGLAASFSSIFIMLQTVLASAERILEMFRVATEYETCDDEDNMIKPATVRGEIKFENVGFFYTPGKTVLGKINFTALPGETIALTGTSGAGKTTMINILIKLIAPKSGNVYLDGHNLKDIHTKWLRKQVGFVSQEIFLFNDTIEANIRYGKPDASLEEVILAAENANIHDDILAFAEGYKTVVGERGVKLSAGQRQRISMARAFLKDPEIIILDEPTSALDNRTEMALKASLNKLLKNRTTFMITHRMSLTDLADRVFELKNGYLEERGT